MNLARKKQIAALTLELDALRTKFETLRDEEQEAYDNMPESLQSSDRGTQSETWCDALDTVVINLEDSMFELERASE